MASGVPDVTASQEPADPPADCPGKKKSKFQTFKNFFVRKKRKEAGGGAGDTGLKASQSTDNVNSPEPLVVHPDAGCDAGAKVTMGNKALSHDSVFVPDAPPSEASEALASSQDSTPGKVKSIQLQLKQAMRLGTPPGLTCMKKREDGGTLSEDDGLPCSPPEISTLHSVLAGSSHRPPSAEQRSGSLSLEGSDSDEDQVSTEGSSRPVSPPHYIPADFSQPASPSVCLDTLAARHRIAVMQRACAKRRPASRELLDSSKAKASRETLSAKVDENQENAVSPELLVSEETCEDTGMEQMDSAKMRGKEEEQEVMAEDEKDVVVKEKNNVMAQEEKEVISQEEEKEEEEVVDEEEEEVVDEEEKEVMAEEEKEVMAEEEKEVMAEEEKEVMDEEEKEVMAGEMAVESQMLFQELEEKMDRKDQYWENEADEHSVGDERFLGQDVSSPSSLLLSSSTVTDITDSEKFFPDQTSHAQEPLGSVTLLGESQHSVGSPEYPVGEAEYQETEFRCEAAMEEESSSLLQEVLNSLKQPLGPAFMLEPATVSLNVETESAEAESADTCQNQDLQLSHSEAQCPLLADGNATISRSAEEEEESDEEECAQSGSGNDEDVEHAENLLIDETVLAIECVEEKVMDLEENDVKQEMISETQEDQEMMDAEIKEMPRQLQEEENTQTCVDGLDSDAEAPVEGSVEMPVQGSEGDNQPSEERLSVTDADEPQDPLGSSEECRARGPSPPPGADASLPQSQEHTNATESADKQPESTERSRARFTIAPAWQRSLSESSFKEAPFPTPVTPDVFEASHDEALPPCAKSEQAPPPKTDATPSPGVTHTMVTGLPVKGPTAEEVGVAESPFGVKLRKTSLRSLCYGSEDPGEASQTSSRPEASEQSKDPCVELLSQKPALPKKPDLLEDGTARLKTAELADGVAPGGGLSSPSWISVAKQKQKIFKDNLLEDRSLRKGPFEKDLPYGKSLSGFPRSTSKDQTRILSPPPSDHAPAMLCSLDISHLGPVEKESTRASPPPAPAVLHHDEPPWLALAKKKAKAWSEMPQIVQ